VVGRALLRPEDAPPIPQAELDAFRQTGFGRQVIIAFVLPFLLILAVLGSIFAGIASPTEAAAVGALGATLLTLLQGRLNKDTLGAVCRETTFLTSMVFLILLGATTFSMVFREMGGDRFLVEAVTSAELSPYVFLAVVMVVVFIAGFFIDFIEIVFIIVPVVAPIFEQYGMNLVWIGVLFALNLQTSFLTPPFGFSLFYLKGVAPPEVTTTHLYRGIVPFVLLQIAILAVAIAWPEVVLWLPELLAVD